MEPSDPTTSPRGRREPPCAIHGIGSCPCLVALERLVLSSLSPREGEREGEEGVANVEDVVKVAVVEEEDDDEPIEAILVSESPLRRLAYKKTTWIQIGPRGRPTKTLAPRTGAREVDRDSPKTGSAVWPPPPPPPPTSRVVTTAPPLLSSGALSTAPPPQDLAATNESPPLRSPIGGRILHRFAHLAKPSCLGHQPGLGIFLTSLECHGSRGWSQWWSGVEWRGAAPARCAGEVDRGGGSGERWRSQAELRHTQDKGRSELGLNPRHTHLIPPVPRLG
jgi:hypothetical protein